MDVIDRIRNDCLENISRLNIIYTCLLVATADSLTFFGNYWEFLASIKMTYANGSSSFESMMNYVDAQAVNGGSDQQLEFYKRPSLLSRMATRLGVYIDNLVSYLECQFNEHTAASIASCSVLIIVLSIICCFIMSLMREEERRIKEQYRKLNTGSSQSFIAINGRRSISDGGETTTTTSTGGQDLNLGQRAAANMSLASTTSSPAGHKNSFSQFQGPAGGGHGYQKIIEQQSSLDSQQALGESAAEPPSSSSSTHLLRGPHQQQQSHKSHRQARHRSFHNHNEEEETKDDQYNNHQYHHHHPNHHHHHHHHHHLHHPHHNHRQENKVRLHELRRETYFGLVRLSKPGCRTVVLLCDAQSRVKLLRKFHQCVYPYRKNKTLQFAFLLIERNIGWYKDLLKSALSERRYFRINPINCIGTVLVLNGFKKYFSVYHASNSRWNPTEAEEPPCLLLEEALLDNLPEWLERVFAGKVNRYYVESWPDRVQYTY